MKLIKNLSVTVTYTVGLGNVEVSDEIFEQLENNSEFSSDTMENAEALDWLGENVKDQDAMDIRFEVDDMSE